MTSVNSRVSLCAKTAIRVLGVSLAILLVSVPLFSQANQGTIQGSVFDQSGGAIAGATVTIVDVARGVSRPLTSDSAGAFVAPNLIPGTYTVRGEAKGFQTLEHANVLLEVGATVRVDLVLQPGAQTQTVTVTSEAVAINTSDATLSATISQQLVADLPMNGRDFKTFLGLRPGMQMLEGGGIETVTANGVRGSDVGYLVDGLSVFEAYTGNSLINSPVPSGDNATDLPFEAIQEINNLSNPKAENGWKPGAIVNIGLKSGANTLHGTAFAMGRDTSFDARNFFNTPPQPKAPVSFEQFGASAGWKMKQDKLFWFADYEGQRYTVANVLSSNVPVTVSLGACTAGSAAGCGDTAHSLVDACFDLIHTGKTITPLSAHLAGLNSSTCAIAPQSFAPSTGPDFSPYPTATTAGVFLGCGNDSRSDNGIGKVDYHINDHHAINGYYFYGVGTGRFAGSLCEPNTDISPYGNNFGPTKAQLVSGTWTWTPSSTRINEFRIGYDHFYQPYYSPDLDVNPLAYGFNTGVTDPKTFGLPGISITSLSLSFGGGQHKIIGPDGNLQILDSYSLVHGNHSLKFGGEFIQNWVNAYQNQGGKSTFTFANLESYLQGTVSNAKILVGDPQRALSNQQYAWFGQDDWRVTRRVILNVGLRWEYSSVLKEANNLMGNFDPTLGVVQVGQQIKSPYSGDFNNFSPRLGVAWDISGNGKMVLRAGGSLMYSYLPIQMFAGQAQAMGITQLPSGGTAITAACPAGCPITTGGTVKLANVTETGGNAATLSANWAAQTTACITGASNTCGTIFPSTGPNNIFNIVCGDGASGRPSPCTFMAVDPKLHQPYVGTWTVGVQRALTNALSLDVSYVGTAGRSQAGLVDLNQAAVGSGYTNLQLTCTYSAIVNGNGPNSGPTCGDPTAFNSGLEQQSRPNFGKFPYLANINQLTNNAVSNYNALQITLNQRAWHGLSFVAGYTYSHTNDDFASSTFYPVPYDSTHPNLQYGPSEFDAHNRFTLTTTYLIPGKKSWAQMLEGWQINSVAKLTSGLPWGPTDTATTYDLNGTGEMTNLDYYGQLWDFAGNPADFSHTIPAPISCWQGLSKAKLPGCDKSLGTALPGATQSAVPAACAAAAAAISPLATATLEQVGCYVSGSSVLIPPALGTDGNATRGIFRGPHFRNWDLSVIKDWKVKERLDVQFRGEVFNVLNHPNFWNITGVGHAGSQNNLPNKGISSTPNGFIGFGCSCVTPDQAAGNLVLGSGGPRAGYLQMKLIW